MPPHPKLIFGDVFITDNSQRLLIEIYHSTELFHFKPLWIVLSNLIAICNYIFHVDLVEIHQEFFGDQFGSPCVFKILT